MWLVADRQLGQGSAAGLHAHDGRHHENRQEHELDREALEGRRALRQRRALGQLLVDRPVLDVEGQLDLSLQIHGQRGVADIANDHLRLAVSKPSNQRERQTGTGREQLRDVGDRNLGLDARPGAALATEQLASGGADQQTV